jgi:hypothetical protein
VEGFGVISFDMNGSAVVVDRRWPEDPLVYQAGKFHLNPGHFTVFNTEQIAATAIGVATTHSQATTTLVVCPVVGGGYQVS